LQGAALLLLSILVVCPDVHTQSLTIRRLASAPRIADFANADRLEMASAMTSLQSLVQRSPIDGERPDRYVVMITVPFSSICFPAGTEQECGVFVFGRTANHRQQALRGLLSGEATVLHAERELLRHADSGGLHQANPGPEPRCAIDGKLGSYAIGALVTDDVGTAASGSSGQSDGRAVNGAFRVSRELRADSSVGALYVGHRDQLVGNQLLGVDGRWRMTPNWVAAAQVLSSQTRRPQTLLSTGTALRTSLDGNGRTYGYQATFTNISPEFAAVTGFIPRTDIRDLTQVASATFRPAGKWLTSWRPRVTASEVWDHASTVLDRTLRVETQFELSRSSHVSVCRVEDLNADRVRSSLVARRSHNLDLLLTYLVNPGTALYVGWNSDRQNVNAQQSAQFFLKGFLRVSPLMTGRVRARLTAQVFHMVIRKRGEGPRLGPRRRQTKRSA
jgi:hypothetical protein